MIRYLIRRLLWAVVLFIAVTLVTFVIFYVIPLIPAKLAAGARRRRRRSSRSRTSSTSTARCTAVPALPQGAGGQPQPGLLVRQPPERQLDRAGGGADHRVARDRRQRSCGWRSPSRSASSRRCGRRPRSTASPWSACWPAISVHPVWLGLVAIYLLAYLPTTGALPGPITLPGLQPVPDRRLLQLRRRVRRPAVRRPVGLVPCPDPALDRVRDRLRGVLCADDPWHGARTHDRGLRAHRARQGRAGEQGDPPHVLRNAMLPVVTMFGMDLALALGGAVIVESSSASRASATSACTRCSSSTIRPRWAWSCSPRILVIIFNLMIDLLYAWIDPSHQAPRDQPTCCSRSTTSRPPSGPTTASSARWTASRSRSTRARRSRSSASPAAARASPA